jgi:hypothetical protein
MMSLRVTQILLLCLGLSTAIRVPSFLSKKKKYTPLLFFTAPKDMYPECSEMEKVVTEVEKELGVHVQRFDVLRDPTAKALMTVLTLRNPPYLYNRESCQVVYVPEAGKQAPLPIDKTRVLAWAKGRFLPSQRPGSKSGVPGVIVSQADNSLDQKDLLEDATLSPQAKSGKEAIKKKTDEKAEASKKKTDEKAEAGKKK